MSHQRILLDLKSLANRAKFEEGVLLHHNGQAAEKFLDDDAYTEVQRLRAICTEVDELVHSLEVDFYGYSNSTRDRSVPKASGGSEAGDA